MPANGGVEDDDDMSDRRTADDMDAERRQKIAYEYLCRLDEARAWIEECLETELPETVELEESMRNGVVLAKLGHFFAPKVISQNKIFDKNEQRYNETGLHFRHTDNIVQWMRACTSVGLPEIFLPETTDVYDKKNMPKCVFCLHALAMFLNRRGMAPAMRTQTGKSSAIDKLADELHGIIMPNFSTIGGLLEEELSDDQMHLHKAIRAINEAIRQNDVDGLLEALQNPDAKLRFIQPELKEAYHTTLHDALHSKQANADKDSNDMYAMLLTQNEVQAAVNVVYEQHLMPKLQRALDSNDIDAVRTLLADRFFSQKLNADHMQLYFDALLAAAHKGPLTRERVVAAIDSVNALLAANDAVDLSDRKALLRALHNKHFAIEDVQNANALRYLLYLQREKANCILLTRQQIQAQVHKANATAADELTSAIDFLDLCAMASRHNDVEALIDLLTHPSTHLHDINPHLGSLYCAAIYNYHDTLTQESLQEIINEANAAAKNCMDIAKTITKTNVALSKPETDVRATLRNCATLLPSFDIRLDIVSAYERPLKQIAPSIDDIENTYQQHCDILPDVSFYAPLQQPSPDDEDDDCFYEAPKGARILTDEQLLSYSRIKSLIKDVNEQFDTYFANNERQVVLVQAQVRGFLAKRSLEKKKNEQNDKHHAATRIQKYYRQHRARRGYKDLLSDNPTLATVCLFTPFLARTEADYKEELEIENYKGQIAEAVRANRSLEDSLRIMDIKIGLLVKNRLTVEEVQKHGDQMRKDEEKAEKQRERLQKQHGNVVFRDKGTVSTSSHRTSINRGSLIVKSYVERLEAYQHLLYHLQTEPQYLTRLLMTCSASNVGDTERIIDSLILPLFNHAAQRREEYLLLQLLEHAAIAELYKQDINNVNTRDMLVPKIVYKLCKHIEADNALREAFKPLIDQLGADQTRINTNPLEIYKYAVGEPPTGMSDSEAAQHPQVAEVLQRSLDFLRTWTHRFVEVISANVAALPYCMRYIARVMLNTLSRMHPDVDETTIAVGQVVYDDYIYPIITSPVPNASTSQQDRKKLIGVARLLQFSTRQKEYDNYLSSINEEMHDVRKRMRYYIREVGDVKSASQKLNYDMYDDLITLRKPTVFMTVSDLLFTHKVLVKNESAIVVNRSSTEDEDTMAELLTAVGRQVPNAQELAVQDPDVAQLCLSLQCTHKNVQLETNEDEMLFLHTKKQVSELLHYQHGNSLSKILNTPATEEQCSAYRAKQDVNNNGVKEHSPTLNALKESIKENLNKLAEHGRVSADDDYQAIVRAIAFDVRNMRLYRESRANELQRLRSTLQALDRKQTYYKEQSAAYAQYIDGCLHKMAPNQKATKVAKPQKPGKENAKNGEKVVVDENRTSWVSSNANKSIKMTGDKLVKKGLIVNSEPKDKNQYVKTTVEVSSSETPGVFDMSVKRPGGDVQKLQIRFQELLQAQYECRESIDLLGLPFNVNELIYTLNRKFLS